MKKYYYVNEAGERVGPMELEELLECDLQESTLVWATGMPQWCEASEFDELADYFSPACPPPAPQRNGRQTPSAQYQTQTRQQAPRQGYRQQQAAPQAQYVQQDVCPPTYTAWAIVMGLVCCAPLAIASLIYGSRVSQDWNAGNYAGAKKNSDTARTCLIVGAVSGAFVWFLLLILAALA